MKPKIHNFLKFWQQYLIIKKSGLFDSIYYLQTYTKDLNLLVNPIIHYLNLGWLEGKNPSPEFDTNYYLDHNPDVKNLGLNPLIHYITAGKNEGRAPKFSISTNYPYYSEWIKYFDTLSKRDLRLIKSGINNFQIHPKLTFFVIVEELKIEMFSSLIDSLKNQLYDNWEAIIFFDSKDKTNISKSINITNSQNKFHLIKISPEKSKSYQLNQAIINCSGKFICFITQDMILRPHTLYMVVKQINDNPDMRLIYTDEDQIDQAGNRSNPYFKPDWNPDLFLSQDYLQKTCFYHKNTVEKVGGFRDDFTNLRFWDLTLRISNILSEKLIQHIPFVLFHKLDQKEHVQDTSLIDGYQREYRNMIRSHVKHSSFIDVQVQTEDKDYPKLKFNIPSPNPLVSIIIPTKNGFHRLTKCIDSILQKTIYPNFESIIINNNSDDPQLLQYLSTLDKNDNFLVVDFPHQFNYSAINNLGAKHANGELLIFLNNDTEVISETWINELVSHTLRPTIGAVGAMLYYPNDTIQHAGVILNNKNIAAHAYVNEPRGYKGQRDRSTLVQNFSAVTGACLAIEKKKFESVGEFDENHLPIAYNDIDLCLKLKRAGYRNLWTPHAELYHQESATRTYDDNLPNKTRLQNEAQYMIDKWGDLLTNDPTYNPNLSLNYPLFSLAYPPRVSQPWKK